MHSLGHHFLPVHFLEQSVENDPLFCHDSTEINVQAPTDFSGWMGRSHFIYEIRMVRVKSTLAKCGCSTIDCSDTNAYYDNIKTFHKQQLNKDLISNM